jgi:hypothetical protein
VRNRFTFFILLVSFQAIAQEETRSEREKFPTSFAFQLRGLANNRVMEGPITTLNNDTVISTIGMRTGFSFSAIIRRQFTDNLGIELGLIHNKRYYNVTGTVLNSNTTYGTDFAFTNYELPVNGLTFIRFSQKIYANAGLGVSFVYKPSNVYSRIADFAANRSFTFEGFAFKKFGLNINGQYGMEYRTEKIGSFYIGGSVSIPTGTLFSFISVYRSPDEGIRTNQGIEMRSPYFSVDLRYYLPKIKNKGVQPNIGPID